MIDVSDGLALDLHRLADASGVGFALDDVPVAPGPRLDEALGGGEDYELVVATGRPRAPRARRSPAPGSGAPVGHRLVRRRPDRRTLAGAAAAADRLRAPLG